MEWREPNSRSERESPRLHEQVIIAELAPQLASEVADLIRRNLEPFEGEGAVVASTHRRLEDFYDHYSQKGHRYLVVHNRNSPSAPLGGAGIGPLAGLPESEGIGEIRDLVIDKEHRRKGLGRKILEAALASAKALGYKRVYLETTPQMDTARKLFSRFGFQAVAEKEKKISSDSMPCYYTLEIGKISS